MRDAQRIDLLFHAMLARFFTIPARAPASGPITFAQMRILWTLDWKGGMSLGTLARTVGVSNPAATEMVDKLVERGLVKRVHSSDDRRQVVLSLRPGGRRILADFAKRRQERFEKLLRVLERRDRERLVGALEHVNEVLAKWSE